MRRKNSPLPIKKMKRLYNNGYTLDEIAKKVNSSSHAVMSALNREGTFTGRELLYLGLKLYARGWDLGRIAKFLGVSVYRLKISFGLIKREIKDV